MYMDSIFQELNKNNTLCDILETSHITIQPTICGVAIGYENLPDLPCAKISVQKNFVANNQMMKPYFLRKK